MHAITKPVRDESSVAVTMAIDLAKDMFELAFADGSGQIIACCRLTQTRG